MSGPKTLSPEEIRMRQEAEERHRLAQEMYRQCETLRRNLATCDAALLQLIQCDMPEASVLSQRINEIRSHTNLEIADCALISETTDNAALRNRVTNLQTFIQQTEGVLPQLSTEAEELRMQSINSILQRISAESAAKQQTTYLFGSTAMVEPDVPEAVLSSEISRLQETLQLIKKRAERIGYPVSKRYNECHKDLSELAASQNNRKRYMVFQDLHRLNLIHIKTLLSDVERAEEVYDKLDAALSVELATYHALCKEYGIKPQKFAFDEKSVQDIRYASAAILQTHGLEVDYKGTMQRIRESLSNMGYSYLGEKEEDRHVCRQIFRVHDQTILHVIYDSTGRVTMEVAIEDTCDREPQAREIKSIVNEQGEFCNSFDRILQGMARDGIHMRKELMCPVGEEFAQVINTSEFKKVPEQKYYEDYSMYSAPLLKYKEIK